ncbi:Mur ligase family protein [Patescibacteria group bacterium]
MKNFIRKIKNYGHYFESHFYSFLFGTPIKRFKVIFVTGTDGKTTTAHFIYNILVHSGKKAALLSTTEAKIADKNYETGLHTTTPSKWDLQSLLLQAKKDECEYLVIEMTSHGIDQHRIVGTHADCVVYTNITNEHLDYFKTIDNLIKTKALLMKKSKSVILNIYDPSFNDLTKWADKFNKSVTTYNYRLMKNIVSKEWKNKFPGNYNLENAAAAMCVGRYLGIKERIIINSLEMSLPPDGRYKIINNGLGLKIIIDFAHTPNALKRLLGALNTNSKKILVFGSAGNRDKLKRIEMGKIAGTFADKIVLTAEDPRTEDLDKINSKISEGIEKSEKSLDKDYYIIKDRKEAIKFAIKHLAKRGDTIIISGKGHEKSMNFNNVEVPWSDEEVVLSLLK